ncbi:Cellulose synthesis regulatory protein [Actinoplanes sp. SE50]|uniref:GGDEF domain-containing protein n=1 Tax=unclassified Actinoplanes TaxID=2626549 RepID=UPI00023EC1B9|nr:MULTISPECIES: GGDEF domain-containing protein [unclassified Actinoplanes]AEV87996.1 Cellulose synthesis regulatory protein [Actinoplanes sp. SE50/110]ATO86400.1 Cellulose synthesis regulatory protein [Actinoplanes sp. SE50]SLM03815.1 Cellulose synthesis regulatory protein [Actinoplanes sp. SE50/110]
MRETTQHAVRLLERAQTGDATAALAEAETVLRSPGGDLACMHFVRVVCRIAQSDPAGAIAAVGPMLCAAEREGSRGWQAAGLASRAWQRLRAASTGGMTADHDTDEVLRDLVAAEMLADGEPDPVAAVNSRVAVAIGWYELRLYELAEPQFTVAYRMSSADAGRNGNRAMWSLNLAEMHLRWALELYQIHRPAEAEGHSAEAERYAIRAAGEVSGADAACWRDNALLYAACARADRHDPGGAAADIVRYTARLRDRGFPTDALAISRPFHGVALLRSGRPADALAVMAEAATGLPPDADWLVVASTHRTRAVLLAHLGSADAAATLAYGDGLAAALWRQRLNTLHAARTRYDLEQLRVQHEQVAKAAEIDPLTGIANRRAFDQALHAALSRPGDAAVLLIDTDKFKVINDTLGHAAGDAALRAIAAALAAQVEAADLVARLGGDEFAALLPGAGAAEAAAVARRMVQAVRDIPDCLATVSIGIAVGPAAALHDVLEQADEAMYRAKHRGGDGTETTFTPQNRAAA